MESPSSDNTSSNGFDEARHLYRGDVESQSGERRTRNPRLTIPLLRFFMLVRKGRGVLSDSIKGIICIMALLCIAEFAYIHHLHASLARIPNDPYDNLFWALDRHSPQLWDPAHQAFLHAARPVPVHSHNDYTRAIPLFEALASGAVSVEADIHLRGAELFVGHSRFSPRKGNTLHTMYLEPLQRMIEAQNVNSSGGGEWRGVFDTAPRLPVVLLVDLKIAGPPTFAALHAQLQPLRDLDYLTYWNGSARVDRPLTIVASGNAPFESILALDPAHRDIFWDAPLERLISAIDDPAASPPVYGFNQSNAYFASTEFKNAILYPRRFANGPPSPDEDPWMKDAQATQIEQARARGLVARYWNTPARPVNVREIAWRVLVQKQVGILNMDDMGIVRARADGWGRMKL